MSVFLSQPAQKIPAENSARIPSQTLPCARKTAEVLRILFPERIVSQNRVRFCISSFGSRKRFAQMLE